MDLLQLLRNILRHWLALGLCALTAGACAFLLTYLLEEQYESTALVLVRPEERLSISPSREQKELLNFPINTNQSTNETPVNTYIEIIESRVIAEKVVRTVGLDTDTGSAEEDETGWMVELKNWLKPEIDAAKEFLLDMRDYLFYGRIMEKKSDFEEAVDDFLENVSLEAITDTHLFKISYYGESPQQSTDVANTTAELFLQYIAEMNTTDQRGTLRFLGDQLIEADAALESALENLRKFKTENDTVSFTEETTNAISMIGELESNLERVEADLAGLRKTHRPDHPRVASLEAERDHLVRTLADLNRKFGKRATTEALLVSLELEVTTAEETYQLLKREYEEARILQAKQISEMRIVSRATPGNYPDRPIRIAYALAAFFVAIIVGFHIVGIRELINRKIRSVEDVERALGIPVLTTIPRAN